MSISPQMNRDAGDAVPPAGGLVDGQSLSVARQGPDDFTPRLGRVQTSAENAAALVKILGPTVERDGAFSRALRKEAARAFDVFVAPEIAKHWPALQLPGSRVGAKLRIAVENVYACGPYTALLLAPGRPRVVDMFVRTVQRLSLAPQRFIALLDIVLTPLCAVTLRTQRRRIALAAAFIALADETLDAHMHDVPMLSRARAFTELLAGNATPTNPAQALLAAIVAAMRAGVHGRDRDEIEACFTMCARWADAEVKNLEGEVDPSGWCWRWDGILAGVDGMCWAARGFVGDRERAWMYGVSELVQSLDDLIDIDADKRDGLVTPAMTGKVTVATVAEKLAETEQLVQEVARAGGFHDERYVSLAVRAYRYQLCDLVRLMLNGAAA